MKKLNFNDLQENSNSHISTDLLSTISGGLENGCHVLPNDGSTIIIKGPTSGTILPDGTIIVD